MDRIERLEDRLQILEHAVNRAESRTAWYRRATLTLLAFGIGGLTIAAADAPVVQDVVQTRRLEVVNDEGGLVFAASSDTRGGRVDVWTDTGQNIFRVGANDHGGDLNVWNSTGSTVFAAYTTADGGATALWSADGKRAARCTAGATGGRIELGNAAGEPVCVAGSDEHGAGHLKTLNRDGKTFFSVEADELIGGSVTLADGAGARRVAVTSDPQGGSVSFLSASGQSALSAGVTAPHGGGFLDITNAAGARVLSAAAGADGAGQFDLAGGSGVTAFRVQGAPGGGATLALFSEKGKRSLVAGTSEDGGLVNVFNQHEVPVFAAGSGKGSLGGAMSIKNGRGLQVIHLAADDEDSGAIMVFNAEGGRARTILPLPEVP